MIVERLMGALDRKFILARRGRYSFCSPESLFEVRH
jgi:hypothetical protein